MMAAMTAGSQRAAQGQAAVGDWLIDEVPPPSRPEAASG